MTSSRVTRLGASFLLSFVLTAGLGSAAFAAEPTDPTPGSSAAPTVVPAPDPTADPSPAPTVAPTPEPTPTVASTAPSPTGAPQNGTPTSVQPNVSGAAPATASYTISGTVTGGGVGIVGAYVEAYIFSTGTWKSTTTGAGGSYSLTPLIAGGYIVYFEADNYLHGYYLSGASPNLAYTQDTASTVTVGPADQTSINVQMQAGRLIHGNVADPNGIGLSNMSGIGVEAISGSFVSDGIPDVNGNYACRVPPSGSYAIFVYDSTHAYLNGYYHSDIPVSHFSQDYPTRTMVAVGATSDVTGINLRLTPKPAWAVTLTADKTVFAPGVFVELTATASEDVSWDSPNRIVLMNGSTVVDGCNAATCSFGVVSNSISSATYHAVIAHSDGTSVLATSSDVTVHWTVAYLVISPATATIADGMSQEYTAEGFDSSDNDLGDVTASTIFFISGSGSGCDGATCTPGVSGDLTVDAHSGTATNHTSATLHVTANDTYHPVAPVRLLDTRYGNGLTGKLVAGTPRTFQITGRGGASNVPAGATAVTANVTVTKAGAASSVYLGPAEVAHPSTATFNFNANDNTASGSTIAIDPVAGTMSVTYMAASGTTDLVLDVSGYFTAGSGGDTFHALTPIRLLDTRIGNGAPKAKVKANAPITFKLWNRGVPPTAKAVTGNLTVVNSTIRGAVYIGPNPLTSPTTSTINFAKGQIRANSMTVALSSTGSLSATYLATSGYTIDLVFDVTGYYTADLSGDRYVPITPAPYLDTRPNPGIGLTGKFTANVPRTFAVRGLGDVAAYASGVTGIVSVYNQTNNWAVYVGPTEVVQPTTSNLNFVKADNCSNGVTVAMSPTGTLSITYLGAAGNTTNVEFVVTGYFVK